MVKSPSHFRILHHCPARVFLTLTKLANRCPVFQNPADHTLCSFFSGALKTTTHSFTQRTLKKSLVVLGILR